MTNLQLHERLKFDTSQGQVLDANRRYLLMRADVLMGMFASMTLQAREQALEALTHSVFTHASDSVRAYADPADPASLGLFEAVALGAASLGWGVWQFDLGEGSCRLTVRNSPFATAFRTVQAPACAPIVGMVQAVCTHVWKQDCVAMEVECSACTSGEHAPHEGLCRFEAFVR